MTRMVLWRPVLSILIIVACSSESSRPSQEDTLSLPDGEADSLLENVEATDLVNAETEDSGDLDLQAPFIVQGLSGQCILVRTEDQWLSRAGQNGYVFSQDPSKAERFTLQAADLETYLLYDVDGGYLVASDDSVARADQLESDVTRVEDGYISGAEWTFEPAVERPSLVQLRSRRTGQLLELDGLGGNRGFVLEAAEGCTPYPELSLDAQGQVEKTTFEDGTLYGIADIHEHIFSNFSFGGGIFHGSAFHRLGVPHALPDCSVVHGVEGRKDFFGHVYDHVGIGGDGVIALVEAFLAGELNEKNHETAGWPDFTEWPDARNRSTHQAMYYRWIERAWLAGLRLMVQHATSDYVICGLMVGGGVQPARYDCEDMTSIDRIIEETWAMQRYIDAQWGGEGKGWFRIVRTPEEAREVIAAGKMAVILGIETSNLFRCYLTPRPGGPTCDEAWVEAQLDEYYERGVRAVFPVHKFDNQFTPGDGSRGVLQLGNFLLTGHWTNMTQDCVTDDMPRGWDSGGITFGGLLEPRDEYLSPPPNDTSGFVDDPIGTALLYYDRITQPAIDGDWCQNATITPLGEKLFDGLMARGMIIELDHFPQWSYRRSYEILEAADYPGVGSHGRHWNGRLFETGGIASFGLGRCQDPDNPGASLQGLKDRLALVESKGGYPGLSLGFDYNGFAGAPGPRFPEGACGKEQPNPITYPFTSYAGDVEFTAPHVGNRPIDFNMEGMIHIGLLPELLQDARSDAPDDAVLEPLFRSAEAYIRMWEKAVSRGAELRAARQR